MITTHHYLDKYPVDPTCNKIIIGTIHPHEVENCEIDFFYGNVASIWNILSDAFPDELPRPVSLDRIKRFLNARKITISDTIRKCKRIKPTALDKDLEPLILNNDLLDQIKNSKIDHLIFTSGFGKNNAFKLFYVNLLKQKLNREIRAQREMILPENFFGRPLKVSILYSPSGRSNTFIYKTEAFQSYKALNPRANTNHFKAKLYKSAISL
jgi:G:T/U-mismatch repair DNA glycosylase